MSSEAVSDEVFARYVVQARLATFEHVRVARHAQALSQQAGILLPLADALVNDGAITKAQRDQALRAITGQASIVQVGQYRLIKELGRGGMGKVFLAEDTLAGRKVAIKILPKKLAENKEFISRFRHEAKATGKLNHENIVAAFDAGEDQGRYFYVMEYCAGRPLSTVLKTSKFIPWEHAVAIVAQVAQGLKHAHENGILHRDIKPDNIFLTSDGTAKILDLGLSKDVDDAGSSFTTQSGNAVGTPHYMAPEQAKGDQLDGRADIYALGATFYHLLTGEPPYDGPTPAAVMLKHLTDEVPNPQPFQEGMPDSVVAVLRRMMARKVTERYADCDELLADLQEIMSGKAPITVATSNKSMKALNGAGSANSRSKTPPLQHSVRRNAAERTRAKAMSKLHVGGMVFIGALLLVGCVLVASALNERNKADKAAMLSGTSSSTGTSTAKVETSASSTGTSVATAAPPVTVPPPAAPVNPVNPANPFVAQATTVLNRTPADVQESEILSEAAKFERRAQEEYDALEKKLATFATLEQKVAALNAFENLYGDSIAGARGRILKSKLTTPVPNPYTPTTVRTSVSSPELAEALNTGLKRASTCIEQGDLPGALREFDNVIKLDSTQSAAYNNRASVKVALGDLEGALTDLDQAILLGMTRWQVHAQRAIVCFGLSREGDYRKSVEDAARALSVTPQQVEARIRNDAQRARTVWVGKSFESKTPETAFDFFTRSQYRLNLGRVADAVADLKQALAHDPSCGPKGVFASLAALNARQKNYAEQMNYLKQWTEACPEQPEALNAYAWELLTCPDANQRNPKLALQTAEKAGELTKDKNPMLLDTLALAYFNTGKAQMAATMEEKAMTLLPSDFPAQERKAYEERLQQFRSALPK